MSTPVALSAIAGGINRLLLKGNAQKTSLYDLLNAYVTMEGKMKPRGGTIRLNTIDKTTKGLISYKGIRHVFANVPTTVPTGYQCHVLVNPVDATLTVLKIHFVSPFMGFLYVAAEFSDNSVYHYWLQTNGTWTADTVHFNGDYVSPSVDNGFAFAATRLVSPNPAWQPNTSVALNDIFEPTVYNGYMFKAIAVTGTTPHTGGTEPNWPTTENAQIQEFGDFGSTTTAQTSSGAVTLQPGTAITDRYGNAGVFTSQLGQEVTPTAAVVADTTIRTWQAGTLYQPGAVVQPSTGQGAFINAIPNGDFEAGDDGSWTKDSGWSIVTGQNPYQGSYCGFFAHTGGGFFNLTMTNPGTVTPGQSVTASGYVMGDSDGAMYLLLRWYDSSDTHISDTTSSTHSGGGGSNPSNYTLVTVTGNAPANATKVRVAAQFQTGSSHARSGRADLISWNLETPAAVSNFLFEAVQANAATSGSTEPTWPTVEGTTVVDGGVTWEAIGTSIITWEALPLMKSGDVEPTWPTVVGAAVPDGNMSWVCADRRITDAKCPQSKYVAISSSKIFAGDNDIIAFCATTNPLDWSSANDAGFLPYGLQNFGSEAVQGLNLYRSNLVAFNGLGYQMWQTDEDPTNMAILDSSPVGCTFSKSIMPVNGDLMFENLVGIRNIGTVGSNANLQAGQFGKAVDPLVKTFRLGLSGTQEPRGLFYPGSGQYWLCFGKNAIVLTINGNRNGTSWSRFLFPYEITDWTVEDGVLLLRVTDAGLGTDLIWQYDEGDIENPGTLVDDKDSGGGAGGTNAAINNLIWWPYLDLGPIGMDKTLRGFDMACNGEVTVSFGYNQKDITQVTSGYTIEGDTMDQQGMVPFEVTAPTIQPRLSFTPGQQWEWQLFNLYVDPGADS